MRGYIDFNFPAFDAAAKKGRELGYGIINPADADRFDPEWVHRLSSESLMRRYARRDSRAILGLRGESGDFIAMLPGWEKSKGATAEHAIAMWVGLTVLDAITFRPLGERPPLPSQFQQCGLDGSCGEGDWGAADEMASMVRVAEDFANRREV